MGAIQYVRGAQARRDLADGWMEEAGAQGAIGFDDGRDPGSVAARGSGCGESKMSAEVVDDAAQLLGCFGDEFPTLARVDQGFGFGFESGYLFSGKGDLLLVAEWPPLGTMERGGVQVRGEKGNGVEPQIEGGCDRLAQMRVIGLLNGATGSDRKVGTDCAHGPDTRREFGEGAIYAADEIMHRRRAIERNDQIIHICCEWASMALEQQAGGEDRHAESSRAQYGAETGDIGVHQGLAAGDHDPLEAITFERLKVTFQCVAADQFGFSAFPDIAHSAAAVAAAERVQDQDGQAMDDGHHA